MNEKEFNRALEESSPALKRQQQAFIGLASRKECIWCNKKMQLMAKNPKKKRVLDAYDWFTPKYLVHVKTTHGYNPEDVTFMLRELTK